MVEIGLLLFGVGIILTAIATLLYKHPKLNETIISIALVTGWFFILIGFIMISSYITRSIGWYVI
jgi:hypothetical protein